MKRTITILLLTGLVTACGRAPADVRLVHAWWRAAGVLRACDLGPLTTHMAEIEVSIEPAPIHDQFGNAYWGLAFPDQGVVRLGERDGRVPAAAHEYYHMMLNGDLEHTACGWNQIDGDTP